MHGSFDEIGNVVDYLELNARRHLRAQIIKLAPHVVRNAYGVGAGLAENLNGHDVLCRRALPKECRPSAQFLGAILDSRHIADAHGRASARPEHDLAELLRGSHPPQSAQPQFLRAGDHAPARRFNVFALQRLAHVQDREVVSGELLRVQEDANLPLLPSVKLDTADSVHRLNDAAHLLVGDLRQLAAAHGAAHEECHDGIRLRVLLCDDWRKSVAWQPIIRALLTLVSLIVNVVTI